MAKVYNSIFAYGVTRSGKIVIVDKPMFDDHRGFTNTMRPHQDTLQEATTYANFAEHQEVYMDKARGTGTTAYMIALVDWFWPPKGREINVDHWTGEIGQTIRVKARANVIVASVAVVIRDSEEKVLEATAQDLPGNTDSFVIS